MIRIADTILGQVSDFLQAITESTLGLPGQEKVGVKRAAVVQASGRKRTVAGRQDIERELWETGVRGFLPRLPLLPTDWSCRVAR